MMKISTEEMVSTHNLVNLIPIVNPELGIASLEGVEAMLNYRIKDTIEIDSSCMVKEGYKLCYGDKIPDRADTILNALNPLKAFCIYRLKKIGGRLYPFCQKDNKWVIRDDILQVILDNLNVIFDGYEELKELFNRFTDLIYSFANFMPVPKGYNAYNDLNGNHRFGKGSYNENNDYPYFYYKNLKDGRDNKMLLWLNDNIENYHLQEALDLQPPFSNPNEYYDESKYETLKEYVYNAIKVIEHRGQLLLDLKNKNFK